MPVRSWASLSFSTRPSSLGSSFIRSGRNSRIHRSIVSAITSFGFFTCSSTLSCTAGTELARKTYWLSRKTSGNFGSKVPRTLRCTSRVSRVFMSS